MATIDMTPENRPYMDALIRLITVGPDDNAVDKLVEGIQELMAAREQIAELRKAFEDVQEYVVAHAFDTTVGRRIDEYMTERTRALLSQGESDGSR